MCLFQCLCIMVKEPPEEEEGRDDESYKESNYKIKCIHIILFPPMSILLRRVLL